MKVGHRWTPRLFVISALCLTLSADNGTECDTAIKVQRNTGYKARVGDQLKIACPISWCGNLTPTIHWIKLETTFTEINISRHLTTEWTNLNNNEGTHFLIFNNILSSDSGEYQCKYANEVSHTINVTVTDNAEMINRTLEDPPTIKTPTSNDDDDTQWWLYVYVAVGIVGFVVIVIVISVLAMRGCKGGSKNNDQSQNQYVDIPMVEQPVAGHQPSPRPSPCVTPSHRTSRRKKPPPTPAQSENVYDQIEGHRNLPEEEGSGVVYAALNHEPRARASPRIRTTVEERSEYAAIRVV